MTKDHQRLPDYARGQFLVYATEDGRIKIDVRLADETVWLTQAQMAEQFQTSVPNISIHIKHVFDEGELVPEATLKKFLTVRREGSREVQRNLDHYNLDVIISVGYRVKSHVATRFRIWATQRPKENINDREILAHAGKISHEMARELAESEYDRFNRKRISDQDRTGNAFDKMIDRFPKAKTEKKP